MYKFCTLLLVLVTLAVASALSDPDPHFEEKCQAKFGMSNEELFNFSKVYTDDTVVVDRRFKCYTKCILDGLVEKDADGKYDVKSYGDRDSARNPSEQAIRVASECKNKFEITEDECEYPFKFMVCVRRNSKPKVE